MCSEMNSEQPAGDSRTDHTHATGVAQSRIMIDSNISNICSHRFGITGNSPLYTVGERTKRHYGQCILMNGLLSRAKSKNVADKIFRTKGSRLHREEK